MKKRLFSLLLTLVMVVGTLPGAMGVFADDPGEDINLIAHYPFNGNANDVQRNQFNGTLSGTGATFVNDADYGGSVLNLAGGTQGAGAVILPGATLDKVRETNTITVATWVYPRGTTNYTRIFDFGRDATYNFYLTPRHAGSSFSARLTVSGSGGEQIAAAPAIMSVNTWHHVAVTISGAPGTMTLYLDGAAVATRALTAAQSLSAVLSATASQNRLYIGRSQYTDSDLNARLADFRIYDRALSAEEVEGIRLLRFSDESIVNSVLSSVVSGLGTLTNRIDNFTFPTASNGAAVAWTSDDNATVNASTGVVTRPASTFADAAKTVTVHVKVTKGEAIAERDLTITVLRLPSDSEVVSSDKEALNIATGPLTEDITLPVSGAMGAAISWASSDPGLISNTGVITRPPIGGGNKTAVLTATITYGTATDTKAFNVTVKETSNAPILIGVEDLEITSAKGNLPELPYYVEGIYRDGKIGPKVRVIWPAPTNSNAYANSGDYVITGAVSGTSFVPKAYVKVTGNIVDDNSDKYHIVIEGDGSLVNNTAAAGSVSIENKTENTLSAYIVTAIYKDGRLQSNSFDPIEVAAEEHFKTEVSIPAIAADDGDYTARIFMWDTNLVPLTTNIAVAESDDGTPVVKHPSLVLEKFSLTQLSLDNAENGSQTVFQRNANNMLTGLLNANDDRFLYMFRQTFGVTQPEGATALGGWDTETTKLRGHATGHYLSALAQAYASTAGDPATQARFKTKIDYMVDNLYAMSKMAKGDPTAVPVGPGKTAYTSELTNAAARKDVESWGTGFISAYPPDQFIMLESYATYGSNNNQIWAPYYTLHKILAGLVDCYLVAGNEKALEIAEGMGLWVGERLAKCTQAQLTRMWGIYIAGEYGGMNETLAKLYDVTKDIRFLNAAKAFDNYGFFFGTAANNYTDGLANNVDTIRTRHANQHLPQILGSLAVYDSSNESKYYDIADNFWNKVVNSYTYSIGGNGGQSNSECFTSQPDTLYGSGLPATGTKDTCESCATYNMLKISQQLFMHDQDAKYIDYYERALYNDIAASISPTNAGNAYFFPVYGGAVRSYGNANLTGFSCCNGTATESHTKYTDTIYMHKGDDLLYVNLYIPSTLKWKEGLSIKQITNYPYSDTVTLAVEGSGNFEMRLRIPYWATSGFDVYVNDVKQDVTAEPSSYISIKRAWANGDKVKLVMPMNFFLHETSNQPNIASIFYGPIIMAGTETAALSTYRPITLDGADIGASITGDPSTLRFTTNGRSLQPLYDFGTVRYSTYFNVTLEK